MDQILLCFGGIESELTWVELLVSLLLFFFRKEKLLRKTKMALGWDRLLLYVRESSVRSRL